VRLECFMPLIFFLFGLAQFHLFAVDEILPPIFKASISEQKTFCSEEKSHNSEFWLDLMGDHIDSVIKNPKYKKIDPEVVKNLFVTLSYLEIYREGPLRIRFMGLVYANASHHLGRLVRYSYWQKYPDSPLKKADKELISGEILGTSLRFLSGPIAKLLMNHSLDLYKNLSWGLGAERICGKDYVLGMLERKHLKLYRAFSASFLTDFMKHFVDYEQSYLQETMYQVPMINLPAGLGVLDKMRFIPFNGEKQLSFYEWCKELDCRTSSLNLENRVRFDQQVIEEEMSFFEAQTSERLKNAQIEELAQFILSGGTSQ
jgi:hypothetical protein